MCQLASHWPPLTPDKTKLKVYLHIYIDAYIFRESARFKMVTLSLTTALCSWSTFIGAQILSNSLLRLFPYMPVTPITIGIIVTFFSSHSLFNMFLKSVYLIVFLCVVVVSPISLVMPISIIWASLVFLLCTMISGRLALLSIYCPS